MDNISINVDKLIEIVNQGGSARTGVDVYNDKGVLLLEKNVPINNVIPLLTIKEQGVSRISIQKNSGGIWDQTGKSLELNPSVDFSEPHRSPVKSINLEKKVKEINEQRQEAAIKYENAKRNIKKVIFDIKRSGGEFEVQAVEDTVNDILTFLTDSQTAFSHLSKEIFSYDDYLYNHSVNTCTIGTAVLIHFNKKFSEIMNDYLSTITLETSDSKENKRTEFFVHHSREELHDIALGYFLHDIGKVLIPDNVLNKNGRLTEEEFELVKKHSYEKGAQILEKNKLANPFVKNTVRYHHSILYQNEKGCYPNFKNPIQLPSYVKICKLADIYDAMTSKRCYKEAINPVSVVTRLFRQYANKDRMLQFILRSFVKIVGIYPPGSILYMTNGQMVFVLDSEGPIILPFTDTRENPLKTKPDLIDLGSDEAKKMDYGIDRERPPKSPVEVFDMLPAYLSAYVSDT